jgi:hypothetical protein
MRCRAVYNVQPLVCKAMRIRVGTSYTALQATATACISVDGA